MGTRVQASSTLTWRVCIALTADTIGNVRGTSPNNQRGTLKLWKCSSPYVFLKNQNGDSTDLTFLWLRRNLNIFIIIIVQNISYWQLGVILPLGDVLELCCRILQLNVPWPTETELSSLLTGMLLPPSWPLRNIDVGNHCPLLWVWVRNYLHVCPGRTKRENTVSGINDKLGWTV